MRVRSELQNLVQRLLREVLSKKNTSQPNNHALAVRKCPNRATLQSPFSYRITPCERVLLRVPGVLTLIIRLWQRRVMTVTLPLSFSRAPFDRSCAGTLCQTS
jgi:hypothetical protein